MGVKLILYILMIICWIILLANCINDIRSTRKWDKKMQKEYYKIINDTKREVEITKLRIAITEANLNIYETPTGKYILVPKEDV